MKKSRFTEAQIAHILAQADAGVPVPELVRKYGMSQASFYAWRKKYSGLTASELRRVKQVDEENRRLKKLVADLSLDKQKLHCCVRGHFDVTLIRLLDDTKCYLHAVIDNFSRRILSWRLSERLDPTTTCEILTEAARNLDQTPTVVADSGVENVNTGVDQLMDDGLFRRVLAQVEVSAAVCAVLPPLSNPRVLPTTSQMRRCEYGMFAVAAAKEAETLRPAPLAQEAERDLDSPKPVCQASLRRFAHHNESH